ncbi:uncharacterized protein [Hemitrygon akajei]|uniref:uncharacterized protein n=1 Tax=Hemitrygon akajei TaxID=2704970 RepID=UPI003BF98ACC
MVQRERRGFLRLESSLLMGAAAGEPAPVPPSLPSCLSPCPSPLPQASRGLSAGDPPRGTPTPTPSLADPEEAEPKKGLRGDSRSLPHTRLCPTASQGQPAPPCGSPSPPTSLGSVAYNGGSDQEEMDPPSPTPSLPHYPRDYHTSPSYRSSHPSPSLRSRATNSLVSHHPSLSLDSTRTAPSLLSRRSYSLASTHPTPSLISQPTPSLISSVPAQSLASSPSASPSPSSSPSPCPSVVQQDSRPPTSVGEEEESEQEESGEEYTPPPTIHLVPNPRLHRALPPHEGTTLPTSRLPLPSPSSASPPHPPTLPSGSHPPTSEEEDSPSPHTPHPGEEEGRLWDGGCVHRVLPHSEGTLPRGRLPITSPHSVPLRGGEEQGRVYRRGPIAHRQLRPQPREQTPPSPPPPSRPLCPHPSLWPKAHHQEPGASVPSPRDGPRGPVCDARNRGSRFCQGRGEQ